MASLSPPRATLDDLYREEGKAELIGGRIVRSMPTGFKPHRVAARIFRSLDDHAEALGGCPRNSLSILRTAMILRPGHSNMGVRTRLISPLRIRDRS
jgi:hypothetical protein